MLKSNEIVNQDQYSNCLFQELKQMTWNAPGEAVPIVLDCVNKAGFKISQVEFIN